MDHHLAVVYRNVILVELGFVAHSLEEGLLLGDVDDLEAVLLWLLRHLLNLFGDPALGIWHDDFGDEVDDLSRDGEVDDLLGQSVGVDLPALGREWLSIDGEPLRRELEEVEIGDQDLSKRNVDKGGENDAEIGRDEV